MNKYCIDKWNANKVKLLEVIQNASNHTEWNYSDLVEMIIDIVLNDSESSWERWDSNEIITIDQGDYQGTLIFLFHRQTYQPGAGDYMMTYACYGSCSVCDTLQRIKYDNYDYENPKALPTPEQTADYMQLCLHLIQHMRCPYYEENYYIEKEELREY